MNHRYVLIKKGMSFLMAWLLVLSLWPMGATYGAETVTQIELDYEGNPHVYVGHASYTLKLMASIQGATAQKDVSSAATWVSSSPSVVKVTGGQLTGLEEGTVTITARYSGFTTSVQVTSDYMFESFHLSQAGPLALDLGEQLTLQAIAVDEHGVENEVGTTAAWTSSKPEVATVDKGKLTLLAKGTTTIKATYQGMSASLELTVQSPYSKLELDAEGASELLVGGEKLSLHASATLTGGMQEDVTDEATWTSSHPAVAKVDKGSIEPLAEGTATITASYRGVQSTATIIVRRPYEAMVVTPDEPQYVFINGEPTQAKAEVFNGLTFREDVTSKATWTSTNMVVATVSGGVITPKRAGETIIRVAYRGFVKEFPYTVFPTVTSLAFEQDTVTLFKGEVDPLPAIVGHNLEGTELEFTPLATWTTSDSEVIKVEGTKLMAGIPGTAELTMKIGDYTDTLEVQVREKVLALLPEQEKQLMIVGTESELPKIKALYEDGEEEDISELIEWTASVPNLYVHDEGMKALLPAKVTLSGTFLNKKISIPVTIEEEVIQFMIDTPQLELNPGRSQSIKVKGVLKSGKELNLSSSLDWTASAKGIVSISGSRVKALAEGTVTLSASYQGKPLTITVKVVPKLKKLESDVSSLKLSAGTSSLISLMAYYDNGVAKSVGNEAIWTSSNPAVATVSQGNVQAIKKGYVTIKASYGGKTESVRIRVQ